MSTRAVDPLPARQVIPILPVAADGPTGDDEDVSTSFSKAEPIYPRSVHGRFATWRWVFVWLTQAVFYGLPWVPWGERQAVLFDLEGQRFFILGLVLYPQDLIYLAALLVLSALLLFFVTAVAGRLWCGYTCPQTVYTEIFLWVERRIEGDRVARMRLDAAPWSGEKLLRKGAKQAAWIGIALVTGITFVGYFVPIRELTASLADATVSPWSAFWVLFYAGATYGNAGFLREQMCKYMCPYARFQSALIDKDSLVITYDTARGEPRGSRSRKVELAATGLGSCIDCTLCVQVCPTGIDIRQGLQNECIGCAACIDVCDGVMDKMGYARGLIRYSTENGVEQGWSRLQMLRRALRPRVLIYGGLLLVAGVAFVASVALRSPFSFDIVKDRGAIARVVEDGAVENVYRLQIMNRTEAPQTYRVTARGVDGLQVRAGEARAEPAGLASLAVSLQLSADPAQALAGQSVPVIFEVTQVETSSAGSDGVVAVQRERSTFVLPR